MHNLSPFKKGNLCLKKAANLEEKTIVVKAPAKESFSSENVVETVEDGAAADDQDENMGNIVIESSSVTLAKKGMANKQEENKELPIRISKPDPNSKIFNLIMDSHK